jgi:hypothetical protein
MSEAPGGAGCEQEASWNALQLPCPRLVANGLWSIRCRQLAVSHLRVSGRLEKRGVLVGRCSMYSGGCEQTISAGGASGVRCS